MVCKMLGTIKRTLVPIYSGLKHIFVKPYTVKWPYEKVPNIPKDGYRYDPKAGIAYPGCKGRHILRMDRCTGCSSCDLACQNIAEAITMTYAFDVYLLMDESTYSALESNDKVLSKSLDRILDSFSSCSYGKYNSLSSFHVVPVDFKRLEPIDELYRFKINAQPIFEVRSYEILSERFMEGIKDLVKDGWRYEVERSTIESTLVKLFKDSMSFKILIQKLDLGYKQNRRSIFPSVDYGRCVFCGFCVDACPFNSLEMTDEFELSGITKSELIYTPIMLAKDPKDFTLTGTPPTLNFMEKTRMVFRRLSW